MTTKPNLAKFLYLSIAAALSTVILKSIAAWLTGSVGLWSDALETTTNLIAALIALWALKLSEKPADYNHHYGHGKAEYFSSAIEGSMILIAAIAIIYGAIRRFIHPVPLEHIDIGLTLTAIATTINLVVGLILIRRGKAHRSATLTADGKHLITDVWTSVGVILAVGLAPLTGWPWLDPMIAIIVGINICIIGYGLIKESGIGLLDAAMPPEDIAKIRTVLSQIQADNDIEVIQLLTRVSGRQNFVEVIIQIPGNWTIWQGHDYCDFIEDELSRVLPDLTTTVHLEPRGVQVSSARDDEEFRFNAEK